MATLIDPPLVDDTLESLPGWNRGDGELWREVHLPKALDAALRTEAETDAAAMGHQVQLQKIDGGTRFSLRTPEVDGVSELDIVLASRISDLAHRLSEGAPGVAEEPGVQAVRRDEPDVTVDGSGAGALVTEAERVDPYSKR